MLVIIILLVILLSLIIHNFFFKKSDNVEKKIDLYTKVNNERINDLNISMMQRLNEVSNNTQNSLKNVSEVLDKKVLESNKAGMDSFKNTSDTLDKKIESHNINTINTMRNTISSLEEKLNKQTKESNDNIKEVIQRISKIDQMQNQVVDLNDSIVNLNSILNDKKARGTFGELRLEQIFQSVFGVNEKIWQRQFLLSNKKQVDFIIHGPEPIGNICIDSKFPLENYLLMNEDEKYKKAFKLDIKKHINNISDKYIIYGETALQAMMFIPSEAIFSEIYANHEDLVSYSYQKKVWITSPTTIMAILNLLMVVLNDIKKSQSVKIIHEELMKLKVEFERYEKRWSNLTKDITKVYDDVNDIATTTNKITKKFKMIENAEIDDE